MRLNTAANLAATAALLVVGVHLLSFEMSPEREDLDSKQLRARIDSVRAQADETRQLIAAMSCRVSSACALTESMRALNCLLSRSSLSGDISKLRRWTPTINRAAVAARLAAVLRRMLPAMLSDARLSLARHNDA